MILLLILLTIIVLVELYISIKGMRLIRYDCTVMKSMKIENRTLYQWLLNHQSGRTIDKYFKEHNYKVIAIYGLNYFSNLCVDELANTEIEVAYGIDENAYYKNSEIEVVEPEEDLSQVDVVVITNVEQFEMYKSVVQSKLSCDYVTIEEVINSI